MIPGGYQIVACPDCGALASYMTLVSGNMLMERVWTDGKRFAPMMQLPPSVVKCQECRKCYWLADAKEVGKVESWGSKRGSENPAWSAAPEAQEPAEEEYYQALQEGLAADAQQERRLRTLAWWRRNDAFRNVLDTSAESMAPASGECRKNLEALAKLLDEADEYDQIRKAEVYRELGDFESAKSILSRVMSDEFTTVVNLLYALCDSGHTDVRRLKPRS